MLGKEHAGAVAVLVLHHEVGGGVVVDLGTSFTGEGGIDLVDALVRGVAKGEAGGAGDAVGSIGSEDGGGKMLARADVHLTGGRVTVDGVTPWPEEWEESKVV